ncbi:MAG: DUF58 domain-containing protein [Actinobacteria bacterium]|nr:DUF58 domain-containing protein [Actinomycetota bacterium]
MTANPPRRTGTSPPIGAEPDGWVTLRRTRTRPTRRAVLNAALGLLLYGAGANVNAGFVIALASLLIGTVPFGWVTARRAAGSVRVRRRLPPRVIAGVAGEAEVELDIATPAHVVVIDHLTGTVGTAERREGGARLHTTAALPRGHVTGGEVEVIVSDVFGLVEARATGTVPAATYALPAIPDLHTPPLDAPWAVEVGEEVAREGGGPEILGVREYRHGDPARAIHWRSSARRSRLVVREFADEALPGVRVDVAAATWDRASLDRAAELVCGIAEDVRGGGYPVEVGVDGTAVGWGTTARNHLALLPPHAGAAARPLAHPPPSRTRVTITLTPATEGVGITVAAAGAFRDLGTVPNDLPLAAVGGWFSFHAGER